MKAYRIISFVLALALVSLAVALVALPAGSVAARGVLLVLAGPEPLPPPEPEKPQPPTHAPVQAAPREIQRPEALPPGLVVAPPETAGNPTDEAEGAGQPAEAPAGGSNTSGDNEPAEAGYGEPPPAVDPRQLADALAAYHQRIAALIEAQKRYPEIARRLKHEGSVLVRFRLSAGGGLLSSSVGSSSGYCELDEAALSAMRRVARFPAFPHPLGTAEREFVVTLNFTLE